LGGTREKQTQIPFGNDKQKQAAAKTNNGNDEYRGLCCGGNSAPSVEMTGCMGGAGNAGFDSLHPTHDGAVMNGAPKHPANPP
jgi:hypothetical protein